MEQAMNRSQPRTLAIAAAVAAALALAACDRPPQEPTVGQQIDKRYRDLADAGLKAGVPSTLRVFN